MLDNFIETFVDQGENKKPHNLLLLLAHKIPRKSIIPARRLGCYRHITAEFARVASWEYSLLVGIFSEDVSQYDRVDGNVRHLADTQ